MNKPTQSARWRPTSIEPDVYELDDDLILVEFNDDEFLPLDFNEYAATEEEGKFYEELEESINVAIDRENDDEST